MFLNDDENPIEKFAKRFAIGYVTVCGLLYSQQQRLMFHPTIALINRFGSPPSQEGFRRNEAL
jgi:hypothetical protein